MQYAPLLPTVTRQYALLLPPLLDKLPLLDNTRRAEGLRRVIIFISVIRQYAPLVQELLDNTQIPMGAKSGARTSTPNEVCHR